MQKYFSEIKDPRLEGYVKHKLADVVVMCAVINGFRVFAESRA